MFDSDSEDVAYFEALFAQDPPEQPPARKRKTCPVCRERIYGISEVHPQCGAEQLSDELVLELRQRHSEELALAKQQRDYEKSIIAAAVAAGQKLPLKVCGSCHKAVHSATRKCSCGYNFRTKSKAA